MPFDPGQMPPVTRHVFVCTAKACAGRGGEDTYRRLKRQVKNHPDLTGVKVSKSGSVGGCEHGPMVVIYPEGVWYYGVTEDRVEALIERHLVAGEVIPEWRFHTTSGCPAPRSAACSAVPSDPP